MEYTLMDAVYSKPNKETISAIEEARTAGHKEKFCMVVSETAIEEARTAGHKETFDSVESLMRELGKCERNYIQRVNSKKTLNA